MAASPLLQSMLQLHRDQNEEVPDSAARPWMRIGLR